MRTLIIGVDSGTQSTKALVVDAKTGKVLGSAARGLRFDSQPAARREGTASAFTWRDATAGPSRRAETGHAGAAEVAAIGVSGQQHGFVPLDKSGEVIRPAKLWCDTSTAAECGEITAKLGGLKKTIARSATRAARFHRLENSLAQKAPRAENFARLANVLLPHDYLNFWLTGETRDGIWRRQRHGVARRAQTEMVAAALKAIDQTSRTNCRR
jgi:xylulokinase